MAYRIGLDVRFWRGGTGGLGRYQRNLTTELLKLDHNNHYTAIITPADEPEFDVTAPNLEKLVAPISHFSLSEQRQLPKILENKNFDLVHFANFNHPLTYHRPFVVTIHDLIMHYFSPVSGLSGAVKQLAYRKVMADCRRAEKIIVPSQSTMNDLIKDLHLPAEKIAVTAEAGEAKFTPKSSEEIAAVRAKYHLSNRYLLFVSRWEKYKGLPVVIAAYEALVKKYPDLGLVICGRPEANSQQIAQAVERVRNQYPNVIVPGFVSDEDLVCLYAGASAYVHPSWYEGFGIMILEAFGAGAPVVTSNVSSLPEVVGNAGLLADPHNTEDFIEKIDQLLRNPKIAQELRTKGFERVKKFSWAAMAAQTLEIYQEVFANKKGHA